MDCNLIGHAFSRIEDLGLEPDISFNLMFDLSMDQQVYSACQTNTQYLYKCISLTGKEPLGPFTSERYVWSAMKC